jgi:hypothetical protein
MAWTWYQGIGGNAIFSSGAAFGSASMPEHHLCQHGQRDENACDPTAKPEPKHEVKSVTLAVSRRRQSPMDHQKTPARWPGALNVSSGSLLRVAVCRGGLTRPQAAVVAGDGTSSSRPTTRNGFYGQSSARTEQYDTGRQKNPGARPGSPKPPNRKVSIGGGAGTVIV